MLFPAKRTVSRTSTTATLIIVYDAVTSPQNVPFRAQVPMRKTRTSVEYDDRCPPGPDLHHMKAVAFDG